MTKVNSLAQDNSALEKKNGELTSNLDQVQHQLKSKDDQLTVKVEDLNTKNTALMKKNDDLEAKDMVLMANITSLTDKDSALETKLSGLESQLKAKVKLEKYRKQTLSFEIFVEILELAQTIFMDPNGSQCIQMDPNGF